MKSKTPLKGDDIERFLNRWIRIATGERQEFVDDTDALATFAIEAEKLLQGLREAG